MQQFWTRLGQKLSGRQSTKANSKAVYATRQEELLAKIEDEIGSLRTDRVPLPFTDQLLYITKTANLNRLLDVAVNDPNAEFMPYWAEIWPGGVILAAVIAREPGVFASKRVLELGPGVGVTAVAAMKEGADLVIADYAAGSLLLTSLNALDQVGHEPLTVLVNWRKPTQEFTEISSSGFDVVLCADILYENKDVKPLVKLLGEIVRPDGEVWITEPGRDAAQLLLKSLRKRGWHGPTEEIPNTRPDPNYHTLDLIRFHRLSRPWA